MGIVHRQLFTTNSKPVGGLFILYIHLTKESQWCDLEYSWRLWIEQRQPYKNFFTTEQNEKHSHICITNVNSQIFLNHHTVVNAPRWPIEPESQLDTIGNSAKSMWNCFIQKILVKTRWNNICRCWGEGQVLWVENARIISSKSWSNHERAIAKMQHTCSK